MNGCGLIQADICPLECNACIEGRVRCLLLVYFCVLLVYSCFRMFAVLSAILCIGNMQFDKVSVLRVCPYHDHTHCHAPIDRGWGQCSYC